MISQGFRRNPWRHHACVCKCWEGLGWVAEGTSWETGRATRRFQERVRWFLPHRSCGVQICPCFGQRSHSAVCRKRRRQWQHPANVRLKPELGRCFLSFNLHVVNTISGAFRCLCVSHECLLCESLMSHLFETGRRLNLSNGRSGSPPFWAKQ